MTTTTTSKPPFLGGQKAQGFGRALEQARIAGGISLDEAATATRISHRYLLALEQEELDELPAPIYARGFLRTYAGYLGLDPADVTSLYPVPYIEPAIETIGAAPMIMAPPKILTYLVGGVVCIIVFVLGLLLLTSGGDDPSAPADATSNLNAPAVDPITTEGNAQPPVEAHGTIEDYVGQNGDEVRFRLFNDLGVNLIVLTEPSDQPAGVIIEQSLPAGTTVDATTALTLTISSGPAAQ
ncbi:MAG: helix-turn-helix domain-containing protein [Dehalococcoidia bacterium]